MFSLTIIRPDGQELYEEFGTEQTVVGRHETCDLRLSDTMVSRNHCLILQEGMRFVVKDLQSRNGTWINGRRIKNRKEVRAGDIIQVGPFRMYFHPTAAPPAVQKRTEIGLETLSDDAALVVRETEKPVEPLRIITTYLSEAARPEPQVPTKVRRERINRNLLTLYRISEELVVSEKDQEEILDYMLDRIFEIFTPNQATILLVEKGDRLVPAKGRCAQGNGAERPLSATILRRILDERVSVLTDDAQEDPRFMIGESVIISGIRSLMAAPVWEGRSILGVIYVDRVDMVSRFQTEDLDLLTAMGHQLALAIQRRRLMERLNEEAVSRAVIRQNLGRFHSPQVVDLILEGAADLDAKETVATIFFCDIVDFTTLCESLTPRELEDVLNMFSRAVSEVVFAEKGTLDKFIGDAAMTIFGAPLHLDDAPVRAVRSALRVRQLLQEAMKDVPRSLRFRVRYGINTGNAIVGNFGSDVRMDYTILGSTVNLASRISKTAEPDQILIGPQTYEEVRDKGLFNMRDVGSRRLKGLSGKKRLFEVVGFR